MKLSNEIKERIKDLEDLPCRDARDLKEMQVLNQLLPKVEELEKDTPLLADYTKLKELKEQNKTIVKNMIQTFSEHEHFKKTKIPRCPICFKNFKQEDEHTWKSDCEHVKDLKLCIG